MATIYARDIDDDLVENLRVYAIKNKTTLQALVQEALRRLWAEARLRDDPFGEDGK